MDKEPQLRSIVAVFLKVPESQVHGETVIDRTAIPGSILQNRLYAKLAEAGLEVERARRVGIRTYGDLLALGAADGGSAVRPEPERPRPLPAGASAVGLGVDLELVANLPEAEDYWTDAFYQRHFAPEEIAYCVLQADPRASFAGRYAAKEAIMKADNAWMSKPFDAIRIQDGPDGRPLFPGMALAITHTGQQALAVAMTLPAGGAAATTAAHRQALVDPAIAGVRVAGEPVGAGRIPMTGLVAWLALACGGLALVLQIWGI